MFYKQMYIKPCMFSKYSELLKPQKNPCVCADFVNKPHSENMHIKSNIIYISKKCHRRVTSTRIIRIIFPNLNKIGGTMK